MEAPALVYAPDGASVLLLQKWEHETPRWMALDVAAQEQAMGRTKPDSIELDDKPDTSHVARTDQDTYGHIFRRNTPYGTPAEHGTMFVGFCAEQRPLAAMLDSMAGLDGPRDELTRYTRPLTGAYYWVPPTSDLLPFAPTDDSVSERTGGPVRQGGGTGSRSSGGHDVGGAAVVAKESLAVRLGPEPDTGLEGLVAPAGRGLEAMMSPAERCQVAVAGGAAGGVRDDVVGVASAGGAAAPREHAGRVEQGHSGAHPVADLVAVHAGVVGQVDDGHHGEVGVGASAPLADLLLEHGPAGGLVAPDHLQAPRTASDVRWTNRVVCRRGLGAGRRASMAAAASGSASTPTARERRTSRESGSRSAASSSSANRAAIWERVPSKSVRSFHSARIRRPHRCRSAGSDSSWTVTWRASRASSRASSTSSG